MSYQPEAFEAIAAEEITSGDIIESHDDRTHTVEGVMHRDDAADPVCINVRCSDGEAYGVEFDPTQLVRVLA